MHLTLQYFAPVKFQLKNFSFGTCMVMAIWLLSREGVVFLWGKMKWAFCTFFLPENQKFPFSFLSTQHSLELNIHVHFWMENNQQMVFFAIVTVLLDNGLNRWVFVFTDAWLKVVSLVFWHQREQLFGSTVHSLYLFTFSLTILS